MKCWICGDDATTGEHLTKASDLKALFGTVSQKQPLYLHRTNGQRVKVNSIRKSDELKSNALLCPQCNNARTAPFDKAWEALSLYLRTKGRVCLTKSNPLRLENVFPGETKAQMLNVHLYFAKLFGCRIVEADIPIEIGAFSDAIMNVKAHPELYISIGYSDGLQTGNTEIQSENIRGKCAFATWFYIVGPIAVNVMYAKPNESRKGLLRAWHPGSIKKRIKLAKY